MAAMSAQQQSEIGWSTEELEELRTFRALVNKAYRQGKYCDITLKSNDDLSIKAHKLILASQNKFFAKKFDSGEIGEEMKFEDISGVALKMCVDYIYNQKIKPGMVKRENAKDILYAGELFSVEVVVNEAAVYIAKNVDKDSAVDVMTKEIFFGPISNKAYVYTANNFQLFINDEALKNRLLSELNSSQMCHLLSMKNLMLWDTGTGLYLTAIEREKQIFALVVEYIREKKESRLKDLVKILTCLKLPLLISNGVLTVDTLAESLSEKPEDLSQLISECLEPFEKIEGKENLATLFSNEKEKTPQEKRMLSDTCKMRYATIPHSTSCSDLSPNTDKLGCERKSFCPRGVEDKKVIHRTRDLLKTVKVYRTKPDSTEEHKNRRVCGIGLCWDSGEEKIGETDEKETDHLKLELENGEHILDIWTHHSSEDLANKSFLKEISSLSNIGDLSFETNKGRSLGPMDDSKEKLIKCFRLRIPGRVKALEKNCPGKYHWLQGFGCEEIKFGDTSKFAFYPIWGFQTHFKVYSVKNQDLDFVAGIKKQYQFSIEGLEENPLIDDIEDIHQIEKSPVHEIVDLDDSDVVSDSENSESTPKTSAQVPENSMDDSIMVVDSGSEHSEYEDESLNQGNFTDFNLFGGNHNGVGDENEPIEIESSSDSEAEEESENGENSKVKTTNGKKPDSPAASPKKRKAKELDSNGENSQSKCQKSNEDISSTTGETTKKVRRQPIIKR